MKASVWTSVVTYTFGNISTVRSNKWAGSGSWCTRSVDVCRQLLKLTVFRFSPSHVLQSISRPQKWIREAILHLLQWCDFFLRIDLSRFQVALKEEYTEVQISPDSPHWRRCPIATILRRALALHARYIRAAWSDFGSEQRVGKPWSCSVQIYSFVSFNASFPMTKMGQVPDRILTITF